MVEMAAMGRHWPSWSRLTTLDLESRRFAHRSQTDDGNPSYAEWAWDVVETPGGCEVNVSWKLNPLAFWRRALLGHVRREQLLRAEVPGSLVALQSAADRSVASG